MALSVVKEDNRFGVKWQGYSTGWLPDTESNRKSMLVFLRLLRNEEDKCVFTFQELSKVVDSQKRQASSGHVERFRASGSDFLTFLTRKRKVDSEVVEAVSQEALHTPLAETSELQQRVNARLGRNDLSSSNIEVALEQIPFQRVRGVLRKHLATGKAHYQEKHLLEEMMRSSATAVSATAVGQESGIQIPESGGMNISDPTSIRKLVTPDVAISSIPNSLRWVVFCMVLYHEGVRLGAFISWGR